ncbi:MAG: hypothetical protein JWM16_644 [Verrucomicrobiales bacterium]|nr:hypothetical protein [Verrucomicrobiales bacterium]
MNRFCIILSLLYCHQLMAVPGIVRTIDSNSISGDIKFTAGAITISNVARQAAVPLTNLLRLELSSTAFATTNSLGKGSGLLCFYYGETNLSGPAYIRLEDYVDFFWGPKDHPVRQIDSDYFSATWVGEVEAPVAGDYSFFISADDGSRLFLKNEYMVERWQQQDAGDTSMTLFLKAGERIPLRMDYFNARGPARARLSWSGPGFSKMTIPKDRLFPATNAPSHPAEFHQTTNGLLATFYAKPDLTGNTFSRIVTNLDLDTSEATAPGLGITATNYSIRWTGRVKADFTEPYTFHLSVDEGARFAINRLPVVDHWKRPEPEEINQQVSLVAGEYYDLEIELQNTNGPIKARLEWSSSSVPKSIIPSDHLFPSKPPVQSGQSELNLKTPPGLILRNGGFVGTRVAKATETQIAVSGALQRITFSTVNVATILCQPLSQTLASKIPLGRTGVLLANGDFVESEFRSLDADTVQVSSVLFGLRKYDARREVVAIILRDARPPSWAWTLELIDRTRLFIGSLSLTPEGVTLLDPAFSNFKVPTSHVVRIRRNTGFTSFAQAAAVQ